MRTRLGWTILPAILFALTATPIRAQGDATPDQPGSPQPSLPSSLRGIESMPQAGGPIKKSGGATRKSVRHKSAAGRISKRYDAKMRIVGRHGPEFDPIERPALANVELLETLPRPPQPPHVTVPTPAYPLENFVTAYTTPPPPVVCHRVRRDPDAPDPRLLYEKPVICEADNP